MLYVSIINTFCGHFVFLIYNLYFTSQQLELLVLMIMYLMAKYLHLEQGFLPF